MKPIPEREFDKECRKVYADALITYSKDLSIQDAHSTAEYITNEYKKVFEPYVKYEWSNARIPISNVISNIKWNEHNKSVIFDINSEFEYIGKKTIPVNDKELKFEFVVKRNSDRRVFSAQILVYIKSGKFITGDFFYEENKN